MKKLFLLLASAFCLNASAAISTNPADFPSNDYVEEWGKLKLVGKQLSAEDGTPVQLKGWSTFGTEFPQVTACINIDAFRAMKSWGANIVRIALYPHCENGEYNSGMDAKIKGWMDETAEVGIYILLDWHVLYDNTNRNGSGPSEFHTEKAKEFFRTMSSYAAQKGYKHVLYELCNEPHGVSWDQIKSHCRSLLDIIKVNDPNAVAIIGTPQWDQQISQAAQSPITEYPEMNLLYSFHLYAGDQDHMGMINSQLLNAMSSVPVFISEWGSSAASGGGGGINTANSNTFLSYLSKSNNKIADVSWCYWSWGTKDEASANLHRCSSYDIENDLRDAGKYITSILLGDFVPDPIETSKEYAKQTLPGLLEIGFFDKGGEGVAFHEDNSSTDEAWECPADGNTYCNAAVKWGWNDLKPNEDGVKDVTTMFRYDECVDVTMCSVNEYAPPATYNIGLVNPGEWLNYTVNVEEAGYYKITKAATTTDTGDNWSLGISVVNNDKTYLNGNIIRRLNGLDQNNPDNVLPTLSFISVTSGECSGMPWECWKWKGVKAGPGYGSSENVGVIFKEAGKYTIRLTMGAELVGVEDNTINCGEFGSLYFEKVDGLEIHESEVMEGEILPNPGTGISSVAADNGIVREKFIVTANTDNKEYAKYSRIYNMMGVEVSNTNLTPGIYFGIK
ncbi:MAG: cellulase family glycosylhydrolase [Paludibacteraceae bacterium]|nr:cellulase family glycosylhydrolase [Paludibacteraceae bacterium]